MNYGLYLFGTNNGTYIQYPLDGEEGFLKSMCTNVKGAQLTILRKDALTHYAYFRHLSSDSSQVFGLCIVTNGVCFEDIKVLYHAFDDIFSRIVFNGKILRIDETGKISFVSDNFATKKNVIEQTKKIVDDIVNDDLERCSVHIRYNYSGLIATKIVSLEERNSVILDALEQNNLVHIYPNKDSDSSINYIEQTISDLSKERDKLRSDYSKLQSQKKQLQIVLVLSVVLVFTGLVLYLLKTNLNETRDSLNKTQDSLQGTCINLNNALDDLSEANNRIRSQEEEINQQSHRITELDRKNSELESSVWSAEKRRRNAERDFDKLKSLIYNRQPFVVKKTSFDFSNGYLSFEYYGMTNEYVNITVRAYGDNGASYSNSANIYIYTGNNSAQVFINRHLNSSKWYSFEILKDNVIIGGDRH